MTSGLTGWHCTTIISDATCGAGSVLENNKGWAGYKDSDFTEELLRISQSKSAYANLWHFHVIIFKN